MVLRLNIDRIELATRDWICKVQIVKMGRPREIPDKKCRFQNLILEDEEECKIKAVMYADEIEQYADKLKLINTYLISTARILEKETVIEHIKPSNELEKPLPPPTKLNITTFDRIPHLMVDSAAEIDILAIVLRCGPQKYAGRSHHRCREITLCDNQAKENKTMLLSRASEKASTSSSVTPMIVTPTGQQVISVTEISSAPSMGVFYVEAEMAILDEFQEFCVLECSGYKQKKRTKDRKDFECPKCN
ncbi:hypothetical protein KY285_031959 [Solanum tuberosum]|nr:hypothetical protein KY285_031959 [Solanum tuberosum]